EDDRVVVGSWIGDNHVNHVLMYSMLTGIRIVVSVFLRSCLLMRIVGVSFFEHRSPSTSSGNELTPATKYDFKFKDYAPWVFRGLREEFLHLGHSDYLVSEHSLLQSMLRRYYERAKGNPHTLLSCHPGIANDSDLALLPEEGGLPIWCLWRHLSFCRSSSLAQVKLGCSTRPNVPEPKTMNFYMEITRRQQRDSVASRWRYLGSVDRGRSEMTEFVRGITSSSEYT
ncbi:hypothetical protein JAAARDRAFT_139180, partial [Jaapia argillacea MUCL 33604]